MRDPVGGGSNALSAVRQGRWRIVEAPPAAVLVDGDLRGLLTELERPLVPGFMTAGYSALGRFIFLAAQARASQPPRPV